jgi:hypothetical protein
MKIAIVLVGAFLLVLSETLFACHRYSNDAALEGHPSGNIRRTLSKQYGVSGAGKSLFDDPVGAQTDQFKSAFAMTTALPFSISDSFTTSTNCGWRTANIEKFFNDSYKQIAEESAQGSGQHLEALASLTGCSAEQYGTFETAMNRNHRYVFANKGYDGSINNFFTVLNTDEDLKQCFGHS